MHSIMHWILLHSIIYVCWLLVVIYGLSVGISKFWLGNIMLHSIMRFCTVLRWHQNWFRVVILFCLVVKQLAFCYLNCQTGLIEDLSTLQYSAYLNYLKFPEYSLSFTTLIYAGIYWISENGGKDEYKRF